MAMLYVPFPSQKEAQEVSSKLLSLKLIACSNIVQSTSIYNWKGKMVRGKEFIAFMKTTKSRVGAAKKAILEMHSYEVPCVLELKGKANLEYEKWAAKICS